MTDQGLAAAFPPAMDNDARVAAAMVPASRLAPVAPFEVIVDGAGVVLPYRIYADEPPAEAWAELSRVQRMALHCLYTRHHDGRVRERHLEEILAVAEPWVVPFVVQLVGEYVVQIVQRIQDGLDVQGPRVHAVYGRFAAANPAFVAVTRQRAVSYWNCYYRGLYADLARYPGVIVIDAIHNVP